MTPQYEQACALIAKNAQTSADSIANQLKQLHERQRANIAALSCATLEFLTTGIADFTKERPGGRIDVPMHGIGWGHRGFAWTQFYRQVARENKRPFIQIFSGPEYNYKTQTHISGVWVTMPKRAYLRPIMSLLLLASECDNPPVRRTCNTVGWTFTFTGESGMEIYRTWREQCATNPEFRKALRLT